MPRHMPRAENDTGQDSFLDVVTNIVGILIILVMVIGARVQQLVFDLPAEAAPQAEEVALLARTVASAEQELAGLDEQIATVQATASAASMGRVQLATALSALERERDQLAAEVDASRAEAAAATPSRWIAGTDRRGARLPDPDRTDGQRRRDPLPTPGRHHRLHPAGGALCAGPQQNQAEQRADLPTGQPRRVGRADRGFFARLRDRGPGRPSPRASARAEPGVGRAAAGPRDRRVGRTGPG